MKVAIIEFHLIPSGGGVLIDPEGFESAMHVLLEIYGDRLDFDYLARRYGNG